MLRCVTVEHAASMHTIRPLRHTMLWKDKTCQTHTYLTMTWNMLLLSYLVQAAASTAGESGGAASQRAERALSMESAASASLPTAAIPKGTHPRPRATLLTQHSVRPPKGQGREGEG